MKKTKRMLALLLTLCMVLSLLPVGAGAANVSDWATFVTEVAKGGTVTLTGNLAATSKATINLDTVIEGGGFTITRSGNYKDTLIFVENCNLTINKLTVDGGAVWGANGTRDVQTGGITAGVKNSTAVDGQLIQAKFSDATKHLTLNSVTLQNNDVELGEIKNAVCQGGALVASGNGTRDNWTSIYLNDTTIQNNRVSDSGAALALTRSMKAVITDATIQGNCAPTCGIVYMHNGGVELVGTTAITKNYSNDGAIYPSYNSSIGVSDSVQVQDNMKMDMTTAINVYLRGGDSTATDLTVFRSLTPTANISVTAPGNNRSGAKLLRMAEGAIFGCVKSGATVNLDRIVQDGSANLVGKLGGAPAEANGVYIDHNATFFPYTDKTSKDLIWAVPAPKTFSVTHTLTNITATGATGANAAIAGTDYVAKLTPAAGYTLPADSAVTVTVGGTAKTGLCSGGTVTIPAAQVTGDIVIKAAGVAKKYDVTLTSTTLTGDEQIGTGKATYHQAYTTTLTPKGGYKLPDAVEVKIGGAVKTVGTDYTYTTGVITIPANKVTGDIVIKAEGVLKAHAVSYVLSPTPGLSTTSANTAVPSTDYSGKIVADQNYDLPATIKVEVVGQGTLAETTDYTYNQTTGDIKVLAAKVTGAITITAVATPKVHTVTYTQTGMQSFTGAATATYNTSYTVTLAPATGYIMPEAIAVKVGGVTTTNFTFTPAGLVTIPGVAITGNIEIIANGIKTYAVAHTTDHITYTGEATARNDKDYTDKLTATGGYLLPKGITVTVGGKTIEPGESTYSYTKDNGAISIHASAITGDIHITAVPQMEVTLIVGPAIGTVIYPSPVTPPKITKVVQKGTETEVKPTGEGGFKYISTDGGEYGPNVTPPTEVGKYKLVITIDDPEYIGSIELPFEIKPKPITSTVTATNRAYDGTKNVTVSPLTLVGVETADKTLVTVTGGSEVGTVATADVEADKPVTLTGGNYSLTGTKAKNYALTQPESPTVTITAKELTSTVTAMDRLYNGTKTVVISTATLNGKIGSDAVTITGGTLEGTIETAAIGTNKPVTLSGTAYTLEGAGKGNYTLKQPDAPKVNITAVPLTISVSATNRVYDGTKNVAVGAATLSGVIESDKATVTLAKPEPTTGTIALEDVGNSVSVSLVDYALQGENKDNYALAQPEVTVDITPKPITSTVTATNRAYDGTTNVVVSPLTLEGVEPADKTLVTVTGGSEVGTVADANVGENKSVTLTGGNYSLTGTKAKNYTLTQPASPEVTITPAAYTYTIADADKTREVDKLTLPETLTAPETGKGVGEETVPGSYEWFTDAGGTKKATEPLKEDSILYCKFTPTAKETVSGNKNYVDTPTIVPVTVLLNKLTVTITGELPATFTYPDPITPPTKVVVKREEKVVNPTGEYVYTFEGRESTTYGPTIVPPTDPGKYNLTIKLIGDPDYQGESGKFPFEIKPKTLTVSVTATHKVYDGNTTVAVTAGPLVGAKPGDDVKLTGGAATGTAADKNVGTDKQVTLTGYTLGGKKAGNYTLTQPVATVNITAAPFTYEVPTTQTVQTGTTKTGLVAPSTGTGVGEETVPGTSKWYKDPECTTEITEPFTTEVTVYHKFVPNVTDPNKNYVGQPVTPVRVIVTAKDIVTITDPGITTEYTGEVLVDPVPTVSPVLVGDPTWEYTYTGTDGSGKAYGPSLVRPTLVGEYRVTIKVTTETQQGEASFPFQINPAPLTVPGITATGTPGETRVTLVNTGAVLTGVKAPDEGEVSLVSDKATGTVLDGKLGIDKTVTCVDYAITGEKAFCYTLTQPGYVTANITGDLRIGTVADEAYTGSPLTPKPAVWFGKLLLTPGTDYNESMTYTGNTAVGQATIEVTGKGAFAGKTAETVFQITKVTPNGTPFYEGTVKEGDTLADLHIGTGAGKRFTHPTTGTYVPGTVIWVDDKGEALPTTTPVTKGTAYRWKFTPTDGTNYEGTAGKAIPKLVGNPYIGIVVLSDAPTVGIPGANVRLVKGSTVFAETVSTVGGRFRFEAVPDGTYNIIGEKDVTGKLRTVTALVTITGGKPDLSTLILPNAEVSAVIETAPGQGKDKDDNPIEIKTPDVVVGGLETPTEELDKRITVKLTVRAKDEKTADQTAMAEIAVLKTAMAKDKTLGLVLDMDIVKRTTTISGGAPTTTTTEAITETDDLLEILIPLPQELQGKGTYIILRHHEGEGAISISESPNAAGEYLTLNSARDLITLHARKFSTYAVYSGAAPYSPDPGTGTGTTAKLVVVDAKGGKLTADPAAPATGETVTITVATEKGYFLEKLLVTGPDGVAVAFQSNGDGTYSFPMPKGRTKVTAEYKKASPANTGVAEKLITDDHILYLIGDDLGTFRPEANMNRAEVAQMFFRLMKNPEQLDKTAKLADVPAGAWYAGPVNAMVNAGIFTGYVDGSFRPEAQITRAEFVAVAARFAKANPGAVRFTDLPKEHWAFSAIATAVAYGWVDGYEDGSFKPGANITRSEVTKIVNAMLGRAADKAFVDAGNGLRLFPDADKSHWAFYEIVEATNKHNFKLVNDSETWSK